MREITLWNEYDLVENEKAPQIPNLFWLQILCEFLCGNKVIEYEFFL